MNTQPVGFEQIQFGQEPGPKEGSRAARYVVDFSQGANWQLDFSDLQNSKRLTTVQCVYLDNSAGTAAIELTADGTGQTMVCEPGAYGYYNLLFGFPAKLTLSSPGNTALVPLLALNVSVSGTWKRPDATGGTSAVAVQNFPVTQPISGAVSVSNLPATQAVSGTVAVSNQTTDSNGNVKVAGAVTVSNFPSTQAVADAALEKLIVGTSLSTVDANLQTAISTGKVNVAGTMSLASNTTVAVTNQQQDASGALLIALGSSGKAYPRPIGNRSALAILNGTAGSANVLSGSPGYYVTGITLSYDPANLAGSNSQQFQVKDSSAGVIFTLVMFMPSTHATLSAVTVPMVSTPPGFFWNSTVANSTLSVLLPGISAGNVFVTINYGTWSFLG